jgi:hypothetical protein
VGEYDLVSLESSAALPVKVDGCQINVSLTGGFVPSPGQKFTLLLDAVPGLNATGLLADGNGGTLEEGEELVIDGYVFAISYLGTNLSGPAADDVELTAIGPVAEIAVEQPVGTEIPDGGSVDFGSVALGTTADLEFTIRNSGVRTLNLTGDPELVSISGDNAFTIVSQPSSSEVAGGGTTTFSVRFAPETTLGLRTAQILVKSDDPDEASYTIELSGTATSPVVIPPSFGSAPAITPATTTQGAGLSATVSGTPGALVKLEASGDLGNAIPWQVIGQITLDGSGQGSFDAATHRDDRSMGPPAAKSWFFRLRQD